MVLSATGTGGVFAINTTGAAITWASGTTTPKLTQTTVASGTGQTLTIAAQATSSGTGGLLALASGAGSVAAGNVELQTGGTARLRVTPTAIVSVGSIPLQFGTGSMPTVGMINFPNTTGNTNAVTALSTSGSVNLHIIAYDPGSKTLNFGITGTASTSPWTNVNLWGGNVAVSGDTTLTLYSPQHSIFDGTATTEHWRYTISSKLSQWMPGANNEVQTSVPVVQTTDATVTTLGTFTVPSGGALAIIGTVIGRKSDGTVFSVDVRANYKDVSGTATLVGTAHVGTEDKDSGASAWAVTWSPTGGTARIRVQGAASSTINWTLLAQTIQTK